MRFFWVIFLISCSNLNYLFHVSKGQIELIGDRVSIEDAINKYQLEDSEKEKLKLVPQIKSFAKKNLEMDIDEDLYSTYIQLKNPYVTYLLRVSEAYELKAYQWNFPLIGYTPYKGFFDKKKAIEALKQFPKEKYDTYIRGVTAYSTLGWFEDSILSSMLSYTERDFVSMIFHELTHTILFFKNHINFNERFAEFIARKASLFFYLEKEGKDSKNIQILEQEWEDELLFSSFMVKEYNQLKTWYKKKKGTITAQQKEKRIRAIQDRFLLKIKPKLHTNKYNFFSQIQLNNAKLLSYRSYNFNMEEFEKIFNSPFVNKNIKIFIDYCKKFKNTKNPETALSETVKNL